MNARRLGVYPVLFGFFVRRQNFWFVFFMSVGVATLF